MRTGCWFCAVLLFLLATPPAPAEGPAWWTNSVPPVLTTNAANDYAPVNMGQLKWIATNAAVELDALPGGRGTNLQAVLDAWLPDGTNYVAVNVGQIKFLASNMWRRLIDVGYTNALPWTDSTNANDFAAANIGQVKYLFDFDLALDGDEDGLANWRETGTGVYVGPYNTGSCSTNADTDADGIEDGVEVANRTDPNNGDTMRPAATILDPAEGEGLTFIP